MSQKRNNQPEAPEYLTRIEAAARIGTTVGTLAVWACDPEKRRALPYEKKGKAVRYKAADVARYIAEGWKKVGP